MQVAYWSRRPRARNGGVGYGTLRMLERGTMAGSRIEGAGLRGVMRLTWVEDHLAHVLDHCETDEPVGAWTGLACQDHGLALGATWRTGRRTRPAASGSDPGCAGREAADGRATLAAGPGDLVAGLVRKLCGAQLSAGRGPQQVLANITRIKRKSVSESAGVENAQ